MEPIEIGSRLELLVDDHVLEHMKGEAEFCLHHPTPQNVVLKMNRPWELGSSHHGYMTVFHDEDIYRMYYAVRKRSYHRGERKSGKERICYAESEDGINWERPSLELYDFEGSRDTNIVWVDDGKERIGIHGFAPFKDTNPECRPEHRYKAVARGSGGLYAQVSKDGLYWSTLWTEPILTEGAFDSQNLAFWDEVRGEYRAYWRDFFETADGTRYRGIRTATSPDFKDWTKPCWLYYPGAPAEELYTNQIRPYFRAPHIFVGFPSRYVERKWSDAVEALPERDRRKELIDASERERLGTAVTDALFMTSRDGVDFNRWGEAFIRPGLRYKNNWFYGDNYINWGIVTTSSKMEGAPEEISFYVSEGSHGYQRGEPKKTFRRYTLRLDGFVSVRASRKGGEIITRPLTFSGKDLFVNFSASAAGSLRVEIQDLWGSPLSGFALDDCVEVLGDNLKYRVRWKDNQNVASLTGRPVRLKFSMVDADLYAFRFK